MNPLAAQKYEKQPPLISPETEESLLRKRPFSNCVLFVLLAVLVFFLGCFAVYTAIAMGVPVEKSQPAITKPEALTKNELIIPEGKNDIRTPEETNKTVPGNESGINSRLRIQILFKGKDDLEKSKEFLEQERNQTEDNLISSFPKGRIIVRKIIFRKNDLYRPEVDSSEEVSVGSDEGIKDIIKMKPAEKSDAPNPLDVLFNLLKFPEDPLEGILKMLEKPRNQPFKVIRIEPREKSSSSSEELITPKNQFEEIFNALDEPKNEPQKTDQSVQNEKLSSFNEKTKATGFEQQEKDNSNPIHDLVSTVDHMMTSIQQKGKDNENGNHPNPQVSRNPPFVRFIKFTVPQSQNVGKPEIFLQPHRNPYFERNPFYSTNMMRFPFSPLSAEDKGSSSGENSKMDERAYTVPPTTSTYTTRPTSPPTKLNTNVSTRIPMSRDEDKKSSSENLASKDPVNSMKTISYRGEQHPAMDGINTENIQPFENFFNNMYRN